MVSTHFCLFLELELSKSELASVYVGIYNEKVHPSRLLVYLVNKQAGGKFFLTCLFIMGCFSIRDFREYD